MDGNLIVAAAMVAGLLLVIVVFIVALRRKPRPAPLTPDMAEPAAVDESMDSVMRALALVQHRYAALVRRYDETVTQLRETEVERDHWKRQALNGRKR